MNKNNLIGLTIKEAKEKIAKIENSNFYQIYVVMNQTIIKNSFKSNKKIHEHNKKGERIYHKWTITNRIYTKYDQQDKEDNNKIIDSYIEIGEHSLMNFKGDSKTFKHNVYYLVVKELSKDNKGVKERINLIKEDIIYKPNELTKAQKRFTL